MELWSEIRRRVSTGELSMRQACSEYKLNFRTVRKIVNRAEPVPYQTARPRGKPKLGSFLGRIEEILTQNLLATPHSIPAGTRLLVAAPTV